MTLDSISFRLARGPPLDPLSFLDKNFPENHSFPTERSSLRTINAPKACAICIKPSAALSMSSILESPYMAAAIIPIASAMSNRADALISLAYALRTFFTAPKPPERPLANLAIDVKNFEREMKNPPLIMLSTISIGLFPSAQTAMAFPILRKKLPINVPIFPRVGPTALKKSTTPPNMSTSPLSIGLFSTTLSRLFLPEKTSMIDVKEVLIVVPIDDNPGPILVKKLLIAENTFWTARANF